MLQKGGIFVEENLEKETKKIEDYLSELYGRKSLKIFEDFKKFIS